MEEQKPPKNMENKEKDNTAQQQQQQTPPSRRDTFRKGFASRHPDVNMEDEEAYYGALDDEYNANEQELAKHRENNKRLNSMFMENPNAAYFMNDLIDGKEQMGVALMRHFGQTFKDAVDDPTEENVKAFADALEEHSKKVKENDRLQQEFEANADASETTIEQWASQHKVGIEQVDAMREFINDQFSKLLVGIITPDMLDFAYKGLNYDNAVVAAEEKGAAAGRNAQIQEKMRRGKGDGVPLIQGGAKAGGKQKASSIFDLANSAR